MYSKLFVSVLFATSATVQASPIVPRQNQNLTQYYGGLVQTLNQQGLTTLSTILAQFAGTQQGQQMSNQLPNANYTILAPSNAAFQPVLPGIQADNSTLAPIIQYHVIKGWYPDNTIASARSHTVASTLLTNGTFVNLNGQPQVQVLERASNSNRIIVRRIMANSTVTSTTTYQNLLIHVIDNVAPPPADLKTALSSSLVSRAPGGFSQFGASLQKVGQLDNVNDAASTTVFAPIDDAFIAKNSTLANLTNDQLTSVLKNHYINNNVLYSTQLANTSNANAASGNQLSFSVDNGVPYVSYNQTRARILRSDVAVKNGVVHVIDAVLA